MADRRPFRPTALLIPGAIALVAGMWTGLVRMGWSLPPLRLPPAAAHGPLMIGGFLGTLIGLERAIGLGAMTRRRWPYVGPVLCGLGGIALLLDAPPPVARVLIALGSLVLVAVFVTICRMRLDWPHAIMGIGALAWAAGNAVWMTGAPVALAAPWWIGFLVLTIGGERLELAQFVTRRPGPMRMFAVAVALFLLGLLWSIADFVAGLRLAGAGAVLIGAWLLGYDLARRTIRQRGLPRFIAACLLPGYAWLIFSGVLWLTAAPAFTGGPAYDAMLHAVLVGFVFSMIFGHAPIILPAVTGARIAYHPRFYTHLTLLHASVVLRMVGDLSGSAAARQWGGLLNVAAVLLFLANTIAATLAARGHPLEKPSP